MPKKWVKNREVISLRPSLFLEFYGTRHITSHCFALKLFRVFYKLAEVQSNSELFLLQIKFNLSCKLPKTQHITPTRTKLSHLISLCLLTKLFHVTEVGKRNSYLHFHLISQKHRSLDCCRLSDARQMQCCKESRPFFLLKIDCSYLKWTYMPHANNYSFYQDKSSLQKQNQNSIQCFDTAHWVWLRWS